MNLGWVINRLKPEFIDLNFHVSWTKKEDNTYSSRCHSQPSQAKENNPFCENTGQLVKQPAVVLVGDNPSHKSDFIMLLSREPALEPNTYNEAMKSINQIYNIGKYPKKKPKTINWEETKACTFKLNQFILENMNNDPIVRLDTGTRLSLNYKLENINSKIVQTK